jgi:hypothetical protein
MLLWIFFRCISKIEFNDDALSFCDLPEITEEALADEIHEVGIEDDAGPFYKQYRCVFGWVAQTAYVFVLLQLVLSTVL